MASFGPQPLTPGLGNAGAQRSVWGLCHLSCGGFPNPDLPPRCLPVSSQTPCSEHPATGHHVHCPWPQHTSPVFLPQGPPSTEPERDFYPSRSSVFPQLGAICQLCWLPKQAHAAAKNPCPQSAHSLQLVSAAPPACKLASACLHGSPSFPLNWFQHFASSLLNEVNTSSGMHAVWSWPERQSKCFPACRFP